MRLLFILIFVLGLSGEMFSQISPKVNPTFVYTSNVRISKKVSDMKAVTNKEWQQMLEKGEKKLLDSHRDKKEIIHYNYQEDPVLQNFMPHQRGSNSPLLTFEGAESAFYPSDANGSVNSNYYVQTVNTTFSVYNKTGTLQAGPIAINTLFTGLPGGSSNDGDAIVLFDEQANRWLITEMSKSGSNDYLLMAVSQSSNPLGAWYSYSFDVDDWPDYPKYGIWRDAYYIGIDKLGNNTEDQEDVFAVERDKMLIGQAAKMVGFINPDRPNTTYSIAAPLDNEGAFAPAYSPGLFVSINDDAWTVPKDQLWIYEMHVDWNNTANSTFGRTQTLDVATFTPGPDASQPVGGTTLDALPDFIMNKPVYRNFSNSSVNDEVFVCCHTVQGSASNDGVRWYELVRTNTEWEIRQQGTYAPDNNFRWNASVTMNSNRRIAMGYSVTGSSTNPEIRYAAQSPSAHAAANGTLDIAEEVITGTTYLQSGSSRWGDYSNISVDPSNDSVFWYTNQYIGPSGGRKTKIAKFKFGPYSLTPDFYADKTDVGTGEIVKFANASYGNITSYQWAISPSSYTFAGGTNANSKNPWIQFSAAGTYQIQLTVSDGTNYPFLNKTNYITVTSCGITTFPWSEDFENAGNIPDCWSQDYLNNYNEDWQYVNGDNGITTLTAHGGSYNAYFYKNGAFSRIVSPKLYLGTLTTPQMDFWYVTNGNSTSYYEFKVLYKDNDNSSWITLKTYSGQTATWTHDTIVLPSNSNNSFIAFQSSTYQGGYGICIDDLSVQESGVSCAPPLGPVSNPSGTSSVVSWENQLYSPTWELEYGLNGFVLGTGTNISGITDTSYTISGLTAQTSYDWYVRKRCSSLDSSHWTGPITFTTTKVPYTLPVSEDFEGGFVKFINAAGNGFDFTLSNSIYHGGAKSARNEYSNQTVDYLVMDSYVDLSSSGYPVLSFWHIAKTGGGTDECKVQISTDNGTSWRTLPTNSYQGSASNYSAYQYFNENSYSTWSGSPVDNTWWKKETFTLDQFKGNKVKVRFYMNAGAGNPDGWYIDDILIEDANCPGVYPDSLFVNNIQATSAELSWTEKGSAGTWDIEYGITGFTQGSGTMVTGITTNPYTLSMLTASTSYDWYVRSSCGSGNYSDWRGPKTFVTPCASYSIPYFEDFESVTTPDLPQCFVSQDVNNDGTSWKSVSYSAFSGSKSAVSATNASRASNDWMFTPGINLQSGVSYQIAFVYASLGGHESLELKYGDYPDNKSMDYTSIWSNNDITSWSWTLGYANVTPTATGTYYFGFHSTSPLGSGGLSIDDIYINANSNIATWTGTISNDWYTATNWSSDTLPTTNTDVSISATATNYPTLNKLSLVKNLTLKSSASGNASLMGENYLRNTGTINFEQFLSSGQWHLISSPVDTSTLNDLFFNHNPDVWLTTYNEPTDTWTYLSALNTIMPVGNGYAVWVDAGTDTTVIFSGSFNSSDVYLDEYSNPALTFTGSSHGYNLVGNPFSSALDWDNSGWDTTNIKGSIWVWNPTAGNYVYRNSQGLGSLTNGIIPRGQGFFIRAYNTNMYFTIPISARVHSNEGFYKNSDTEFPYAVIKSVMDVAEDEVWISFVDGASDKYDNGFDVEKFFSNGEAPEIYFNDNEMELSILSLGKLYNDTKIVNLSYKAGTNGNQSLVLSRTVQMDNFDILLEDLKLDKIIDFKKQNEYDFDALTSQNPDRFRIHFINHATTLDEVNDVKQVNIYSFIQSIFIIRNNSNLNEVAKVEVYDLLGRKVYSGSTTNSMQKIDLKLRNAFVIVKVKEKEKTTIKKVYMSLD